ncbi:MAG: acyl-CoA dehydrogenase family protein [Candidatus Margulisiibacteriota bacterium]|nr:acyl-CoA dehydrogenase family protein [Candidatus Margulisiibacteriota bacterium]
MDFSLDENQQMYVGLAKDFVKKEIQPKILELDNKHDFPRDIMKKAWEVGFMNLCVSEEYGGLGADPIAIALIVEEIAYGCSGIATSVMCNDLANAVIAIHGSHEQKEKFLKPFTEKPLLSSFCLTEAEAGSDNLAMTTFIKKREDGKYVLNGTKQFITNATYADQYSVFCKLSSVKSQLMSCVIVPKNPEEGKVIPGKPEAKLGQHLSNTAEVTFEDVVVDPSQIIGNRRLGFKYLIDVLDYSRPMIAAIGAGIARKAYDLTLEYTKNRVQFGTRICDMPVARETLVKMYNKMRVAQVMTQYSAWKLKENHEDKGIYASLAKNMAAEACIFNANEGLHLHGGYGFTSEYEISKLARDAHIIDIYEGTREVQTMIQGRELVS